MAVARSLGGSSDTRVEGGSGSVLGLDISDISIGCDRLVLSTMKTISLKGLGIFRMASQGLSLCARTFFFISMPGRIVLTRLRLLMTSVLRDMGRGRPCSLRNKPQALQSTAPDSSRRQRGVVEVWQFWQVGCCVCWSLLAAIEAMLCALYERCSLWSCTLKIKEIRDGQSRSESGGMNGDRMGMVDGD